MVKEDRRALWRGLVLIAITLGVVCWAAMNQ